MVSASVQSSPPQITLSWPLDTVGAEGYSLYRKRVADTSWGNPIATFDDPATGYTDSEVTTGTAYEYQVVKQYGYETAYGYLATGIELPLTRTTRQSHPAGGKSSGAQFTAELDRLLQDLVGDGWTVIRHDVSSRSRHQRQGAGGW